MQYLFTHSVTNVICWHLVSVLVAAGPLLDVVVGDEVSVGVAGAGVGAGPQRAVRRVAALSGPPAATPTLQEIIPDRIKCHISLSGWAIHII